MCGDPPEGPELEEAFIRLWEFIEGLGLDAPTENDLKYLLCMLGEAAQLPEELASGSAALGPVR